MTVIGTIRTWGEMIKFSHSVFALPFALMATFLAGRQRDGGAPSWIQLGLIVVCMVTARSFAMTFNRMADWQIDARNPRTADRAIPSGTISVWKAAVFFVASGLLFILACGGFLVFSQNPWPLYLSLPTLVILSLYSYAKRATIMSHFILGAAIAIAPAAAWIAIDPGSLGWSAVLLFGVVLFWIAGFDILYACQDISSDRREGLFSIPARFGIARSLVASRTCHLLAMVLLAWMGLTAQLGWIFWSAAALTGMLLVVEQSFVKPDDLSRLNLAFFTINGCISLLLGIATVCDVLLLG